MDPFFTIITPVKNGSKYIGKYIYSLKSQLFDNWEAIIIDDFSDDNTLELLQSATKEDKRFQIRRIKTNNQKINGPYYARNLAIEKASGKYICFLDIDDFWSPNKLGRQYKIIQSNSKIKLIYSKYLRFRESNNIFTIREQYFKRFNIKNIIKIYNPIPNLTSCIQRETVSNLRFKPINHEDYLFWQQIIQNLNEEEIFYDEEINSIYRVHSESISSSKIKAILWIIIIYKKFGYGNLRLLYYLILRGILQLNILFKEFNSFSRINSKHQILIKKYQKLGLKLIKQNYFNYDFLGSAYFNTKPEELEVSLKSIENQTLKPKNVILVCDGKISTESKKVICKYKKLIPIKTIQLKDNKGLGMALREGIKFCKSEYILRFDTDDYNLPKRAEKQLNYIVRNDCDIVGSYIYEFINSPKRISSIRKVPVTQLGLKIMIFFRNPFNHPSVCFKKESIINLDGGYRDIKLGEDYDLWIRAYFSNLKVSNMSETLVGMNSSRQIDRRIGNTFQKEFKLLQTFYKCSNISIFITLPIVMLRILILILPKPLLNFFYKNILRS